MSAYDQTADQDLLSLGQERRRLMEEMADKQRDAALLTLRLDEQRLKIEREIFNLEQQKARIALATQRAQLSAQLAILQLQLQEGIRADQARGVTPTDKITASNRISQILAREGVPAQQSLQSTDANGLDVAISSIEGGFADLALSQRNLAASSSETARLFDLQAQSQSRVNAITEENINKQRELAALDTMRWWNEFLDSLDGIGTVLGEATAGLSEFRRSVASAFARGLREGNIDEAIADAGGQLSDRIVTSIVDEFVLKPMERNLFAGIRALMGDAFKPPEKPEEIFRTGTQAIKDEIGKGLTIEGNMLKEIQSFHADFNAAIERVFNKSWQPPAGPQEVGPAASQSGQAITVGGVANMLPGTKGGPNINEGVGWSAWRGRNHNGQDLGLDPGDPIHARRAGTVKDFYSTGFGQVGGAVVIKYDDGTEGTYGHVNPMSGMRVGETVSAGQRIATVTNDGQNTHLHYELRNALGQIQNPLEAIKQSLAVKPGVVTAPPAAPPPLALPPAPTNALGATTNRLPVPGAASSQVDLPTNNRPGVIPLQTQPFQDQVNQAGVQFSETGQRAVEASQGLAVLKQELTTATSPASGSVPGTAATPALPATPAAAAGTEAVISSQQGLAAANNAAAQDIKKAGDAAKPVPQGFSSLGTAMSGAIGALGSIAMGIGGYQQMQEGGTYNTLMGLAGIFGAVGGIAGMFTPGGSLFGMFRASGGPVNARQPYIVGERGPELFLPDSGGDVLSTNDTAGLFKRTRSQLEASRTAMQERNQLSFADMPNKPIDVRYESRVINGVEYVTTEQLRVATREAAERGKALAFQSMQGSVKTRRRLGL